MLNTIYVKLFGETIGALHRNGNGLYAFEYTGSFASKGIQPSPIIMPAVRNRIYSFPDLNTETFRGLPGMIADSMPDRFGRALLDQWLETTGGDQENALEALSYLGRRCMGALEYEPARDERMEESTLLQIDRLVDMAREVMASRENFKAYLQDNENAVHEILKISTSAGGQRAKAVIAINDTTGEIRSGQIDAPPGFEYWLLKLDGFDADAKPTTPADFGKLEYVFSRCVKEAGINMTECRLWKENGRTHFLTKRFDRQNGEKLHMQTLCALRHYDYALKEAYSYEQAFRTIRRLNLPYGTSEEMFRRMAFNVMALNMDDHTKNISFLMDKTGKWSLSPAYDMSFAHNPKGLWTKAHQMSINKKTTKITSQDLLDVATAMEISHPREILEKTADSISLFPGYAKEAGVSKENIDYIQGFLDNALIETKLPVSVKDTASSIINEKDKKAIASIGVGEELISTLEATGHLEIDTYNYRPVRSWDGDVPQVKNTLRFSFHDGGVFVLTPDQKQEIPLQQAIFNAEVMAAYIHKPDADPKLGLGLENKGPKLRK